MAEILKGAPVVAQLNEKLTRKVAELNAGDIYPQLAILRVGEKPDDIAYERGAVKRCEKVGVLVRQVTLPAAVSQVALLDAVTELNQDKKVHGVLLLRPLPDTIDEQLICNALAPEKDVDGITNASSAGVYAGTDIGYPPCTPQACMEILDYYGIDPKGKKTVVIGRSLVVGKPVAMMLIKKHATVTICHTRTIDMPAVCREAEILIAAAGKAGMVKADHLSPGQIVLDVGINMDEEGKMQGDVSFETAESIVRAITPVPGGVGTVTTSVLVKHVVEAAEKQAE